MKRTFAVLSVICLLLFNTSSAFAQPVYNTSANNSGTVNKSEETDIKWPDNKPSVNSAAAIVMEASTGAILYSKNIHKTYYPASITKILTALLAIENSSLGETVDFSKKAIYDVDLDSSRIGIDVGEKLTMEQSLYGIMLESANPHGLPDPDHYTSAYDMALIARAAINNDIFRQITGTRTYVIPPTNIQEETRYLANHHKFVNGARDYEGVIGGKTGYTSKALYTLVTFAERDGLTLISVIMHCDSIANEYSDTAGLLNYGFDNFSIYNIADTQDPDTTEMAPMFTKYSPLFSKTNSQLKISPKGNIILPNDADYKDAKKEIVLTPSDLIVDGENVIGAIKYTYGDTFVGSADIIYDNTVSDNLLKGSYIPTPTEAPKSQNDSPAERYEDSGNLKPVIIAIIIGCLLIGLTLYLVFVEIPYRKRRSSYLEKRSRKRNYHKKIDF